MGRDQLKKVNKIKKKTKRRKNPKKIADLNMMEIVSTQQYFFCRCLSLWVQGFEFARTILFQKDRTDFWDSGFMAPHGPSYAKGEMMKIYYSGYWSGGNPRKKGPKGAMRGHEGAIALLGRKRAQNHFEDPKGAMDGPWCC
mgnify:CR=1 FL=1